MRQPFRYDLLAAVAAAAFLLVGLWGIWTSARRGSRWVCEGLEPTSIPTRDLARLQVRVLGRDGRVSAGEVPLATLLSGPALVNFWSASCAPCIEELPSLVELARRSQQVRVLFVNVDESLDVARKLWTEHPLLGPEADWAVWAWDPGGRAARALGTTRFPETYLVNRPGRSRWKVVSSRDWTSLPARRCLMAADW